MPEKRYRFILLISIIALLMGASASIPQTQKCFVTSPTEIPSDKFTPVFTKSSCSSKETFIIGKGCFPPAFNC
jgi:hypothetical protein